MLDRSSQHLRAAILLAASLACLVPRALGDTFPPPPAPPPVSIAPEDYWVRDWAAGVDELDARAAWLHVYQDLSEHNPEALVNNNPKYPGGKQCPPTTVPDAIHLTDGLASSCAQVCIFPNVKDKFSTRGGEVGRTCAQAGCAQPVGEGIARNIYYFTFACDGGGPSISDECVRHGLSSMDNPRCIHELDLLYEFAHTRHPELRRVRLAGDGDGKGGGLAWHQVLAVCFGALALVVAVVALVLLLRILDHRPQLLDAEKGLGAQETLGGGSLRKVDVFRGLRVAEIHDGLPGSARKLVVTRDGVVYEWGAGPTKKGGSGSTRTPSVNQDDSFPGEPEPDVARYVGSGSSSRRESQADMPLRLLGPGTSSSRKSQGRPSSSCRSAAGGSAIRHQ